uniref:Uncharacterized protein n=1 Tax=Rhizophagus irregularis (strain DAOM 181602 / DAOM 197198 / MUCL 43194) TaxID=747089 RepID=U9UZ09_RHIID
MSDTNTDYIINGESLEKVVHSFAQNLIKNSKPGALYLLAASWWEEYNKKSVDSDDFKKANSLWQKVSMKVKMPPSLPAPQLSSSSSPPPPREFRIKVRVR